MPNAALDGTTALVTGASRGIGAAIALALAVEGTSVAIVARGTSALHAMAARMGAGTVVAPCDLMDGAAMQRMVGQITYAFGGAPDIIVNNAGIFRIAHLMSMSEELFASTIQINLVAPFSLIRAFLPAMHQRGSGHIVTIGSIADRNIMPENGAYASAKYGARALHEVLRAETKGTGIRATLVSPAATDTPVWDDILVQGHSCHLPTRDTMLRPSAVADAVVYAVSRSSAVNVDELRISHS